MKARDIIPGWPRPRSVASWCSWNYPRWWFRMSWIEMQGAMMVLDVRGYGVPPGAKRDFMLAQIKRDIDECRAEFAANRAYHESQQRMVDEWRRHCIDFEGLIRTI